MGTAELNKLRKSNTIPFKVVEWLEELVPIVAHDELGMMYRGSIVAEDEYGRYSAVIGTTDRLLKAPAGDSNDTPYRILKVESADVVRANFC